MEKYLENGRQVGQNNKTYGNGPQMQCAGGGDVSHSGEMTRVS